MDFAKLCDDAWDSSLEIAADCVELHARAKAAYDCDSSYESCAPRRKSDFLYDVIHLNVGYWMQLARLGSAYSIYAHRAVSALYGLYAEPCEEPRKRCTLEFVGAPGDTR